MTKLNARAQTGKKFSKSTSSTNPDRPMPTSKKNAQSFYRSKSTINRLNMYNNKPNKKQRKLTPLKPVRIEPDRRWFGNTRTLTQNKLNLFRTEMSKAMDDPYNVVLKRSKLPLSLLTEPTKESKMSLLSIETFDSTFGRNQQRKRPKLLAQDLQEMVEKADESAEKYNDQNDRKIVKIDDVDKNLVSEEIFRKGTSKRIWGELYKVVDSSDVIVQVIDARDPMGTRCKRFEAYLKKDRPHKHLVLLLNKSDLVPVWAVQKWVKILSTEYPTLAFHSSINHPFGKHSLIQLLRQFSSLMCDKKCVSIGFIGYPNVGKSSVINTLRKKKVCKAAPVPGETRVWQYVSLTNRIYLIDCPGVVPNDPDTNDDASKIIKGAIRPERVEAPEQYIDEILARVKREYIVKHYDLIGDKYYENGEEFLKGLAKKMGKLLKGGEPDISTAARIVLNDWLRGRLPFFIPPPFLNDKSVPVTDTPKVEQEQNFDELKCTAEFNEDDIMSKNFEDQTNITG